MLEYCFVHKVEISVDCESQYEGDCIDWWLMAWLDFSGFQGIIYIIVGIMLLLQFNWLSYGDWLVLSSFAKRWYRWW